jgi:hypothetical protein
MLVVIDKFSKYGHFLGLSHPYTAASVAKMFMDNIYKLYGMPQFIISDRDKVFTNNLSSSYHPQTDGQKKRLNQCLETYLRCMIHACPNQWASWLSLAAFCYNTTYHSAIGKSPFEVLYGYAPKHFGISAHSQVAELEEWLQDREAMNKVIHHNLRRAQDKMKMQADNSRMERNFEGDWVYLKLQAYVQQSVARRSTRDWVTNILDRGCTFNLRRYSLRPKINVTRKPCSYSQARIPNDSYFRTEGVLSTSN